MHKREFYRTSAIYKSQPTRCGHTLRGVHCRVWRVAAPLRTLQRHEAKNMTSKNESTTASKKRTVWIKMRVTHEEKESIVAKADAQGQTVTDFIRQRALDYRLRQTHLEKELIREIARIGSNLNQLARWANAYKSRAEALDVLAVLVGIEKELKDSFTPKGKKRENLPCT